MSFWDNLKQGMIWGLYFGMSLGSLVILVFRLIESDASGMTNLIQQILTGVIYIIIFGMCGGIFGSAATLFVLGVIKTLKVVHWGFAILGGSILNLLTTLMGSVVGWISMSLIPILLIIRQYLGQKSPIWIEKALNDAIVAFLTNLIFTFLIFCFQYFTKISLLGV